MIFLLAELTIALTGLLMTFVLFRRFPILTVEATVFAVPRVSVVIPARNEQSNLPRILTALKNQSTAPFEILVVDDASTDQTAEIARSFGVRVLTPPERSEGWMGKCWACQFGAEHASGELLLFLDADVYLAPDGLSRLIAAYERERCALSVQPYHLPKRPYEQLSLFFNLVQVAANGTALRKPVSLGLFGPVILVPRAQYASIGGHERIKSSIVEDIALGVLLRTNNIPYSLFIGDVGLSYRMYPDGLKSLLQGWTKNLAAGAANMPPALLAAVFLWITSAISVPLHLILFSLAGNAFGVLAYGILYVCWVTALLLTARRIGKFSPAAIALFPVPVATFLTVFIFSLIKRIFGLKVIWKGRAIRPDH